MARYGGEHYAVSIHVANGARVGQSEVAIDMDQEFHLGATIVSRV